MGVPDGTAMSMPACKRPQRIPNGLTTGPFTGQINPLAEGVEGDPPPAICARMRESAAASAFASAIQSCSCCLVDASACRLLRRAPASLLRDARRRLRRLRCSAVRTATACVSDRTTTRTVCVFARAVCISSRATPTSYVMRLSCSSIACR